jgi:hypothetical protein
VAELRDAGNGGTSGERLTPVFVVVVVKVPCPLILEFNRLVKTSIRGEN